MKVIKIGAKLGDVQLVEVENNLKALQELVGGYIQAAAPAELRYFGVELLCNEEGLLLGYPCNENLFPFFYVGDCIVVGVDGENFTDVTDLQIELVTNWLDSLES